ncbi:MAG: nucleotide sugar dehydrogenase [Phascolarctobacterium sp.]
MESVLEQKNIQVAVVGLGYVGLPLAVAFAEHVPTIGFDINEAKINLYKNGIDPTEELGSERIKRAKVVFTADPQRLQEANFVVVAVPTPVNSDCTPDLAPVEQATALVGQHLSKGTIVVFESTVWPGVTEDICMPILERESGLKCGVDFKIAYSPERINPGDKVHRLATIKKIVSGMDAETLQAVAAMYSRIIEAGVFPATSIKVAEAAKLAENAQRDINIAFMNELAIVFEKMGIRTKDVLEAMNTKWNALGFTPGLVGGHCIGVDPYYFIYKAELLGYHSQIIAAGRKINNGMGAFVADNIIKQLILADKDVRHAKIYLLGLTFKENCPDTRNSRVVDIIQRLAEYGISVNVVDPWADEDAAMHEYGVKLTPLSAVQNADCIALCVAHREFVSLSVEEIGKLYKTGGKKLFVDVKSAFKPEDFAKEEYAYWSL